MMSIDSKPLKELNRKIKKIANEFGKAVKKPKEIDAVLFKNGTEMCNHIITEMRNTTRAPWSYKRGKNRHHPSMPGAFPAIDKGEAVRSIAFDTSVSMSGNALEIGVTGGAPYMKILEKTERKNLKRPWLDPTVKKFESKIMDDLGKIVPDNVSLWLERGIK